MKKLKNISGETLVETLVSLLICCLGMTAISTVMASAGNIMTNAEEKFQTYCAQNEVLTNPGTSGTDGTVTVKVGGTGMKLNPDYDGTIKVEYYKNNAAGEQNSVTAYYVKQTS